MVFSAKGNALVSIIAAVLILATVVVMVSYFFPFMPDNSDSSQKIQNETNYVVKKSILVSLDDFMRKGFSKNPVWYYNNPSPPLLPELTADLNEQLNSDLNSFLEELTEKRNYFFGENILLEVKADFTDTSELNEILAEIDSLPDDFIEIELNDFLVSSLSRDKNKTLDLSEEKIFALRTWFLYKKMFFWTKELNLSEEACNSIEKNSVCNLSYCWCGNTTTEMISDSTLFRHANLSQIIFDFNESILENLEELNSDFFGTGISCTIDYNNFFSDFVVSREQKCVSDCAYNTCLEDQTECGELFIRKTSNVCAEWKSTEEYFVDNFNRRQVLIKNKNFLLNEIEPKNVLADCGQATVENIALNPGIFSVIKLSCSDSNALIEGFENVSPLNASIYLAVSVISACEPDYVHLEDMQGGCPNFSEFGENGDGDDNGDDNDNDDDDNDDDGDDVDDNDNDDDGNGEDECDPQTYQSRCYDCVEGKIIEKPLSDACPEMNPTNCQYIKCKEEGCQLRNKCPSACAPCNAETGKCMEINCVEQTGNVCAKCRAYGTSYSCVIQEPDCSLMSNECEQYELDDTCTCRLANSVSCDLPSKCNGSVVQKHSCEPSTGNCIYVDEEDCSLSGEICEEGECKEGEPL